MGVKLRGLAAVPLIVAALAWVAIDLLQNLAHRSLDDTAYWGTILPWLLNAIWYAGVIASVVVVLLVTPAVLLFRALRKWPILLGPRTRDIPDQRRALEQRGPRV